MSTAEPRIGAVEGVKPPGARELTPRAILCGLVVAAIMGASYPYMVLKLGFGPNVSVVAAFFGYLAPVASPSRDYNRWENNIVQTAGTAGGPDRVHVRAARRVRHAGREPERLVSAQRSAPCSRSCG